MKKTILIVALSAVYGVASAGELVITENTGSSVSLKAKTGSLEINGTVLPTPVVVGRKLDDKNQTVTIGPAVSLQVADNTDSFVALIEHGGELYSVTLNPAGIEQGLHEQRLYSDASCEILVGITDVGANTIIRIPVGGVDYSNYSNQDELYSVSTNNLLNIAEQPLYSVGVGSVGNDCWSINESRVQFGFFAVEKLAVTVDELLGGAVAPFSVVYR